MWSVSPQRVTRWTDGAQSSIPNLPHFTHTKTKLKTSKYFEIIESQSQLTQLGCINKVVLLLLQQRLIFLPDRFTCSRKLFQLSDEAVKVNGGGVSVGP